MTPQESMHICRLAYAYSPAQKLDDYTPEAWEMVLGKYRHVDALQAVTELAGEQEWIHVSHIVSRIKRIRRDRVNDYGTLPDPPSGMEAREYQAWYAETVRAIADGDTVKRGEVGPSREHSERLAQVIESSSPRSVEDA